MFLSCSASLSSTSSPLKLFPSGGALETRKKFAPEEEEPGGIFAEDLATATATRPQCDICGREFKTRNALLDHEHMHKGNTTCGECGRICSTRGNLKQHLAKMHAVIT